MLTSNIIHFKFKHFNSNQTITTMKIINIFIFICAFLAASSLASPSKLPLPLSVQLSHSQLISGPTLGNLSDARIVGGVLATEGEVPHQIALLRNGGMWCGGSLIGPRTVLTAGKIKRLFCLLLQLYNTAVKYLFLLPSPLRVWL